MCMRGKVGEIEREKVENLKRRTGSGGREKHNAHVAEKERDTQK